MSTMTVTYRRRLADEGRRFDVTIPEMGDGYPAIDLRDVSYSDAGKAVGTLYDTATTSHIIDLAIEVGSVTVPA